MTIAPLNIAATGIQAAEKQIEVLAHNIANANTTGFKKSELATTSLFYNQLKTAGTLENTDASGVRPVGVQVGTGTKVDGTYRILTQGNFKQTNNPLDMALSGSGYFAISLPNGRTGYTRAGSFQINNERRITTIQGHALADDIVIPDNIPLNTVSISEDGVVTATDPNNTTDVIEIGQIQVHNFANERGLKMGPDNLLEETPASGEPIASVPGELSSAVIKQGFLEESNTSAVEELTGLIAAQRRYELNTRVMRVADETQQSLNQVKS